MTGGYIIKSLFSISLISIILLYNLNINELRAESLHRSDAIAVLGTPKYAADFSHFDYANPTAPKGGGMSFGVVGTFDNFNRYALRGNPEQRSGKLYDSLFVTAGDEMGSYYPLIALNLNYSDSYQWVEFNINPKARFHDGQPITADDVAFTFNKFMTEGVPTFRLFYKGTTVKVLAPLTVRFDFPSTEKDKMLSILDLPIFPRHFWQQHPLGDPLSTPPLGSGPYRVGSYRLGQYTSYERVKDYWAADLPVNRGLYNFDTLRYDYYLDDQVALTAFKAGAYDLRIESSPKNWATQYQGGNFAKNYIVKQVKPNQAAQDTRWMAFNIQRPLFQDRRVREAITLAFDFEWMNRTLYYQAYQRTNSYFQNTQYVAQGYPSAGELVWLEPLRGKIPDEVFGAAYQPPIFDGSGSDRQNLLRATQLLQQAGWQVKDRQLVNRQTGQPFTFELLLRSGGNPQYVLPFQHNLQRLGITMTVREVDSSQFLNRLRKRDFDMMPTLYSAVPFPSSDLKVRWHSHYIDSTYNTPGVKDAAIDILTEQIAQHQNQEAALLTLGRALDRVLTWNHFMIPMWYSNQTRGAYWDKFVMPESSPTYAPSFDNWWFDANKAAQLPTEHR